MTETSKDLRARALSAHRRRDPRAAALARKAESVAEAERLRGPLVDGKALSSAETAVFAVAFVHEMHTSMTRSAGAWDTASFMVRTLRVAEEGQQR